MDDTWYTEADRVAKLVDSTTTVGTGKISKKKEFYISEDIDLTNLKKKAKDAGITINDLFMGACVSSFSNLNLP